MKTLMGMATLGILFGAATFAIMPKASSASNLTRVAMTGHSQDATEVKTFTGTIAKHGDQFILRDETSKSSYQLDDQQTAEKFAGKKVRVTGILDATNETIRVKTIEEATA
jgi:hypothetical protein